jgi:predicted dehydrogenase
MLSAVIIGLGRIGVGRGVSKQGNLPNHLKAMHAAGLPIAGVVDPDKEARAFIRDDHPANAFQFANCLSEIPRQDNELIAICTPVETHASLLSQALARQPRLIVLEKPAAENFKNASALLEEARSHDTDVLVNFHRRFDPRHRRWKKKSPDSPRLVTARFGKGLWNYASHIVDLLLDWYGPVESVQALAQEQPRQSDPNLSFRCRMVTGFDAVLIGVDDVNYDQFEIDIYGTNEKIEMRGGGCVIRKCHAVDDHYHEGYADLVEGDGDTGPVDGFRELYEHIIDCHETGDLVSGCTLSTAVENAAILDAALISASRGGISVEPKFSRSERS